MFNLKTDIPEFFSELSDIVRLFTGEYDDNRYEVEFLYCADSSSLQNDKIRVKIQGNKNEIYEFAKIQNRGKNKLEFRKFYVRECKNILYKALRAYFCRDMPWGALTGIRPSKLVYDYINDKTALEAIPQKLQNEFFVSNKKAKLITEIVKNQRRFFTRDSTFMNLYIHIPFCPSRCNYCSFVSTVIDKQQHLVEPYIKKLCQEIAAAKEMITTLNYKIYSVYIGGGTPTALSDGQFERVLKAVTEGGLLRTYSKTAPVEFTCEAGRPETITAEKLTLMKTYGVTRVSCNPQSLNHDTLLSIGRGHTVQDFYEAYERIQTIGFSINVDLIAGLNKETADDFARTLKKVEQLRPQNITVHTLSRKRGSAIKEQSVKEFSGGIDKMTDFSIEFLSVQGYLPYYLYRQKMMLDNLENVGYCLPDMQCVNNITVMEEMLSVLACGAGAISKLVLPKQNRIERFANIKDIKLYLERFDEQTDKKADFFSSTKICI